MYKLTFQLIANQIPFVQNLYVNENMVIISLGNKKSVYLKDTNNIYTVDDTSKSLAIIDFEKYRSQLEQLSKSIGKINIQKDISDIYFNEFEVNVFQCKNEYSSPSFKSEIKIIKMPELAISSYYDYMKFEMQNQYLKLTIKADELIVFNNTEIELSGNSFVQKSELLSIEKGLFTDEFDMIDKCKLLN